MKRKVYALLMATLMLCMSACGSQTSESVESSATTVVESSVTSGESKETEASVSEGAVESKEEGKEQEQQKESVKMIAAMKSSETFRDWDSVTYDETAYVEYDKIYLTEEAAKEYPALAATLKSMASLTDDQYAAIYEDLLADVEAIKEDFDGDTSMFLPVYDTTELSIARSDDRAFTIASSYTSYSGGVHGYYAMSGINIDSATGKELTFKEVFKNTAVLPELVASALEEEYDTIFFVDVREYLMENITSEYTDLCWLLDYEGVTFFFNPYEIASYADGLLSAKITFEEHPEIFNPYYMESPESYIVGGTQDYLALDYSDYDGDGSKETIFISPGELNDWDCYDGFNVDFDGKVTFIPGESYYYDFYLMRVKDGKSILMVQNHLESDYAYLDVYSLSSKGVKKVDTFSGYFGYIAIDPDEYEYAKILPTDPSHLRLSVRTDLLSTLDATTTMKLEKDGTLTKLDNEYHYNTTITLTAKQSISGKGVDEAGNENGKTVKVNAGDVLHFYSTDRDNYVTFKVNGELVRFYVNYEYWPMTIDGIDAEELFEGMMFAG